MSTILRALKKLEQEKTQQKNDGPLEQAFNARLAVHRKVRADWSKGRRRRWGLILAALVVLGGALLFVLGRHNKAATVARSTERAALHEDQTPAPAGRTRAARVPPRAADRPPPAEAADGADRGGVRPPAQQRLAPPAAQTAPAPPAADRPARPGRFPADRPADRPERDAAPAAQVTAPEASRAASVNRPEAVQTTVDPAIERFGDGRLKIQAIAWAAESSERMAVINNKILREGDSIENYTITLISQDQVVLRGEGGIFRLIFGRP